MAPSPKLFSVLALLAAVCLAPVSVAEEADVPVEAEPSSAYRVGIGDVLDVRVFGEEELSRSFEVYDDGTIAYPLLGRVAVAGLTVQEIQTTLRDRLGKDYLVNPHVTVVVEEYRSQKVYVLGAVKEPGFYELRGATRLLEIVSRAGGVLPEGGKTLVVVRGGGDGEVSVQSARAASPENTVVVDGYKLFQEGDMRQNVLLSDRDVVYVPKAREVFVIGEVKKPGPVVFSEKITLLQAIGQAGGLTELASTRRVQLVRMDDGAKQSTRYNLKNIMEERNADVPLKPDDVIVVPKRIF